MSPYAPWPNRCKVAAARGLSPPKREFVTNSSPPREACLGTGPARSGLGYQDFAYRFEQLTLDDRLVEQTARAE